MKKNILGGSAIFVFLVSIFSHYALAQSLIQFTSKTHGFSFNHSDRYLNFVQESELNRKRQCPSGNTTQCEKDTIQALTSEIQKECSEQEYREDYDSPAQCVEDRIKWVQNFTKEINELYSTRASETTDPEGSEKFTAHRSDGNMETFFDSFSYFAKNLTERIYYTPSSPDDIVYYKRVHHGKLIEADGKEYPTISHSEGYFLPEVSYSYRNGTVVRTVDSTKEYNKLDAETKKLNSTIKLTTSKTLTPHFKNGNGVAFYQIDKGTLESYQNLYCAIGKKTVCFDIESQYTAQKRGDKVHMETLAREKTIMDPIMKSFSFTAGAKTTAQPTSKTPVTPVVTVSEKKEVNGIPVNISTQEAITPPARPALERAVATEATLVVPEQKRETLGTKIITFFRNFFK